MVILGAGGHAKEVLEVLSETISPREIVLFDNVTPFEDIPLIFDTFKILRTEEQLKAWFTIKSPYFVIGVGGIKEKKNLWSLGIKCGGKPYLVKAKNALIGNYNISIGEGSCIMHMVFISNSVKIGKAVLVNTRANIHHDVVIGDYSDVSPCAVLLGNVQIGKYVYIGAGAVILPRVKIGNYCTVGAGALVTKDVPDNITVKGNPAK